MVYENPHPLKDMGHAIWLIAGRAGRRQKALLPGVEPEKLEESLADIIITTLTIAHAHGLDMDKAVAVKMAVMKTREREAP